MIKINIKGVNRAIELSNLKKFVASKKWESNLKLMSVGLIYLVVKFKELELQEVYIMIQNY